MIDKKSHFPKYCKYLTSYGYPLDLEKEQEKQYQSLTIYGVGWFEFNKRESGMKFHHPVL